jgi:hypothetical protein
MAKIVTGSLRKSGQSGRSVTVKRVRDDAGQMKTLRTVDAASETFGDDLRHVFTKNVAKARKDNRQTVGVSDVVVPKR